MSAELIHALEQLEKERGISKDILIDAIEQALISAYKKNFGTNQNVEVTIEQSTGEIRVYALKTIVDEVMDPAEEMSIDQAKRFGADFEVGDMVEVEVTPRKFGRIAAQTAKQVVMQRIREAEREIVFGEFASREEDILTGVVSRFERRNVVIDLGRVEAILPPGEQTPGERYNIHDRLKVYVINVKKGNRSPQIYVSRTHPGLVKRLLELEVPEINDGTVEIKTIAREAGSRTKIAISSRNENVDPVGACVGQKGSRIRAIVDELRGEMIDVIKWSPIEEDYIASALSPAKVLQVGLDEDTRIARVVVPDFQLSLAIGKEGQNARLAAKLTGWKIDIKSETQMRQLLEMQLFSGGGDLYGDGEDELYDGTGGLFGEVETLGAPDEAEDGEYLDEQTEAGEDTEVSTEADEDVQEDAEADEEPDVAIEAGEDAEADEEPAVTAEAEAGDDTGRREDADA
jgi:N utilization substance protein A